MTEPQPEVTGRRCSPPLGEKSQDDALRVCCGGEQEAGSSITSQYEPRVAGR